MQIGFVVLKEYKVATENDGSETKKYMKMEIRTPFVRPMSFKIAKNKKEGANQPDYVLYYYVNGSKEKFRLPRVGALWLKKTGAGETMMEGYIESMVAPGGRFRIAIFKAKPNYDGEELTWIYDVVWSHYEPDQNNNYDPSMGQAAGSVTQTGTPVVHEDARGNVTQTGTYVPPANHPQGGDQMPPVVSDTDEIPF